jgi:catalase
VKFYTDEGNWDIVGNDIPVFFHHDAMRFVDLVHAGKPEPHNDIPQAQTAHNNFWDWMSLTPESSLMHMYALSDWGIPRAYHNFNGHGVNTYKVVGKGGKEHLVKFHWHPEAGVHQHVWDEALKCECSLISARKRSSLTHASTVQGQDPDFHRRYMGEVLAAGMYPKWNFYVQLLDPALEDTFYFDPLDATKIWPESLIPKQKVGTMTLHRGNDDFFAESENVAFCTSHIIPGIDFSDDPLLQGRNFSYNDTQTSRLGGQNYNQIPINQPLCPVYNHNRENYHPHVINRGTVNYYPNRKELVTSMAEPCAPTEGEENGGANGVAPLPDQVAHNTSKYIPSAQCGRQSHQHGTYSGGLSRAERAELIKTRSLGPKFANYYEQAQIFYNSMDDVEKGHIQDAIVFELGKCDDPIIHERMVERFAHINLELAQFTAQQFGVEVPEKEAIKISTEEYPEFSINKNNPRKLFAPRVAIIALPGLDQEEVFAVKDDLANKGAMPLVIGARSGPIDGLEPAFNLESCRSTMFDALYLPLSNEQVYKTALFNGRVKHFVREMTGHFKPIAVTGTASIDFLDAIFQREISEINLANKTDKGLVECYGIISYPNAREDPTAVSASLLETLKLHRCWNRPGVASLAF